MAKKKPANPVSKKAPETGTERAPNGNSEIGTEPVSPAIAPISIASKNEKTDKTDKHGSEDGSEPPQSTAIDGDKNQGNDRVEPVAAAPVPTLESVLPSHARLPGEGRAAFWERTRKALRAAGLPRGQGPGTAYEMATREAERLFPPVPPVSKETEETAAEPVSEAIPASKPVSRETETDQGVKGLGDFPRSWPTLPANAPISAEIAWVSANRLLVRDGTGVNLSRAMSPPPSYAALSWLETSILFPSKFADISVKATADQDDEKEFIRREKIAVEEIRSILKEMMDAKK